MNYTKGMETQLDDIPVMFVVSPNGPIGAGEAFRKLEDAIDWQLKGRKFYGTMLGEEYRACMAINEGDDPQKLGFETWTIPGGLYYRGKVEDWEKHVPEISKTFSDIKSKVTVDESRPFIEYYRSQAELILYVPAK